MPENFEEGIEKMKDVEIPEQEGKEPGLELAKGEETEELVDSADKIAQALKKDEPVTEGDMKRIEEAVQNIHVDFGGEKVSLEELKRDPDMIENMKICNRIKQLKKDKKRLDIFDELRKLTRITPDILRVVIGPEISIAKVGKKKIIWFDILQLDGITNFSDECAEVLRNFYGYFYLDSVTSLSDKAMENLSHNVSSNLHLKSLKTLSDESALSLSRMKGFVHLQGLESVSENGLRYLARMERTRLVLSPEMEERVEAYRSKWSKLKKWLAKNT